jgi:all-trans-retinol dehydrogenase (NAD+)
LAIGAGERGGRLVLLDIDQNGLERTQAEITETTGQPCSVYACDLSDLASINHATEKVIEDHGGIDVLINNAGIVTGKPLLEATDADIVRTMDVNTLAPIRLVRAFLPSMLENDSGHVVNISSAGGIVASAKLTDYCASKFALFGFDEALRIDLRRLGSSVKTTVVCPFYIDTGMFSGVKTRFNWLLPILDPEEVTERILQAVAKDHARLVMPPFVYASWATRLLPVGAFDALGDFFGISRSMDEFTGRKDE